MNGVRGANGEAGMERGAGHGPGVLVLVVGPSGAGKDTLLDFARRELARDPRFVFARRVVTRPAAAGAEDHDTASEAEFAAAEAAGRFLITWRAHGLAYGLPGALRADLAAGRVVIANASRGVVAEARLLAARVLVVRVTASPETLARRLADRGRETAGEIEGRLRREVPNPAENADLEIRNDGSIAEGGARLVAALRQAAG